MSTISERVAQRVLEAEAEPEEEDVGELEIAEYEQDGGNYDPADFKD